MTAPEHLQQASRSFLQIAETVDAHGARVPETFTAARELCTQRVTGHTKAATTLLDDLAHRLEVWQQVWPRLGKDAGFRTAVSREARLWAQKLQAQ